MYCVLDGGVEHGHASLCKREHVVFLYSRFSKVSEWYGKTKKLKLQRRKRGHLSLLQEQSPESTTVVCLEACLVRWCKKALVDDNIWKEMRARPVKVWKRVGPETSDFRVRFHVPHLHTHCLSIILGCLCTPLTPTLMQQLIQSGIHSR